MQILGLSPEPFFTTESVQEMRMLGGGWAGPQPGVCARGPSESNLLSGGRKGPGEESCGSPSREGPTAS